MGSGLVPIPPKRDITRAGFSELPAAILRAGDRATWRFLEFFTANIRNKNTRAAYAQAVTRFFRWCDTRGIQDLSLIRPVVIAGYIETHPLGGHPEPAMPGHLKTGQRDS
jgi:hypothetical protein